MMMLFDQKRIILSVILMQIRRSVLQNCFFSVSPFRRAEELVETVKVGYRYLLQVSFKGLFL